MGFVVVPLLLQLVVHVSPGYVNDRGGLRNNYTTLSPPFIPGTMFSVSISEHCFHFFQNSVGSLSKFSICSKFFVQKEYLLYWQIPLYSLSLSLYFSRRKLSEGCLYFCLPKRRTSFFSTEQFLLNHFFEFFRFFGFAGFFSKTFFAVFKKSS